MQEFPLSKLKIKIHNINNPTSVFKKKSFLTLNCINKSKTKTPLRIFSNDELPHYMLPIKCQLNKTENNEKEQNKIKIIKPNIKLSILSRNKSDIEIKERQNKNDQDNKDNNMYDIIPFNKNNLNTNLITNAHLNDYSSSNKDNNENIISELNIINHNSNQNSNYNNNNTSFEEPSFQSLISELQKKISEQKILLSTRNKEIEKLKRQLNNNNNNQNNDIYNNHNNLNNFEIIEKENNEIKNNEKIKIIKLEEEIKILKNNMEKLNEKYLTELNNKKALEDQYTYLKNNMKNNLAKLKDINKYEDKIIEQENKIISLEEKLNKKKNLSLNISKETNFEIISQRNNLILNEKQYNDIQLILNALLDLNNLETKKFSELMDNLLNKGTGIGDISQEIFKILKINEKDNKIVLHFIKDFLFKSQKENNTLENNIESLFKYNHKDIKNSNKEAYFVINSKNKKLIYEKCKNYDYKNKHKIPFNYFKHLYKEICHKDKKAFSFGEFYYLIYECKKDNGNEIYSLYDILYENLLEKENIEIKLNPEYKLKYPDLVKNFLDKIIKEAYDKKNENYGNNHLNRARSFERDFFEQNLLDNDTNNNKMNLEGND